ncbi:unnamed protein product [Amaranthus hypochondriacus]
MADTPKFHPALAVTNVKSLIPITLDMEHGLYHSWSALFMNLVTVHDLHHHIIPPTEDADIAAYNATKAADPALWKRLDAAVLQWIYGTLSTDLLQAILRRADTAQGAWSRLESMFQDNKASRATHLEEELATLAFENFSSIDSYCNHMKSIADRLADVDAPVSNSRLVLRLTGGLPEAYSGTVDIIQNQEPLPSFESCRSRLKLAERTIKNRLAKEGASGAQTALVTTSTPAAVSSSNVHRSSTNNNKNKRWNKGGKHNGPSSLTGNNTQHSLPHSGPNPPKWQPSPWTNWAPWFSQWPNTPPPLSLPDFLMGPTACFRASSIWAWNFGSSSSSILSYFSLHADSVW